jgi:putative Holliday junction resolvase
MRDAAMSRARKPTSSSSSVTSASAVASIQAPDRGTILAFDFGEKRIGVATGESETRLAHALPGIHAVRSDARFAAIARLVAEWRPARLVVGLPLATDGSAHAMTLRARRFARQLEGRFRLPVTLVDERYSSVEAEGLRRSRPRADASAGPHGVDSAAAQLILQQHFAQLILQQHFEQRER